MHCIGKKHIGTFLLLMIQLICGISVYATNDPVVTKPLLGSKDSVKTNYESFVIDYGYFSSSPAAIQQTYVIKNIVSVGIEEGSNVYIQTDFSAIVKLHISKYNQNQQLTEEFDKDFTIEYKKAEGQKYNAAQYYSFENAYQVRVKIVSITPNVTSWDVAKVLRVDNTLQATRDYAFDCSKVIAGLNVNLDNLNGELTASWGDPGNGQTEYDLEWSWIDESAITDYQTGGSFDQDKLFTNNATRVSISATTYNIPLLYDGEGRLFVRVRPAQLKYSGQRVEGNWTWQNAGNPVFYSYAGHQNELNWQASTSYAEEGKRKSVIQYFDGTLRNRQMVTKDNTTGTTVVAESFYDYQGRPVIQVLPAPTINTIISYTKNFNKAVNYNGYPKWAYDELLPGASVCANAAPALDSATGTARYYSGNNDLLNSPATGYNPNKYIPNAEGYPFTETRFTPDGRVAAQGGIGINHQLGSNHETKYVYEAPAQEELDALFGTDAGVASHYNKNMVKDANGQYSVSYTDMHGRTIATALAGNVPAQLDALSSYNTQNFTKQLIDDETNRVVGRSIISSKSLVVMKDGVNYHFNYQLNPDQLQLLSCTGTPICYDCLYHLKFSIVSDCNTNGNNGVVYQDSSANFTLGQYINQCNTDGKVGTGQKFSKIFDVTLNEGSYTINKVLTLSGDAQNIYRDSVFVKNDTCKKQIDFYNDTYNVLVTKSNCAITCASCDSAIGHDLNGFRTKFVQQTGMTIPLPDSIEAAVVTAFNNARANCDRICNGVDADGVEAIRDIKQTMLMDVAPPYGQYANPENATGIYNLFNNTATWSNVFGIAKPAYLNPINYTWNGVAPAGSGSFKNEFGQNVQPDYQGNAPTPQIFSSQFQTSWAEQLLPNHPEYCKLKTVMEKLPATYKFEADLNALNKWNDMVAATTTPGLYITNLIDKDPFFKIAGVTAPGAAYYSSMLTRLTQYVNSQSTATTDCPTVYTVNASMWQVAQSSIFCRNAITIGCYNSPQVQCLINTPVTPALYPATGCANDWDLVWKNFRTMYLTERKKFISQYLAAQCSTVTNAALIQQGHTPRFPDLNNNNGIGAGVNIGDLNTFFTQLGNGDPSAVTIAQNLAIAQYDSTCVGYANTWIAQLSGCDILNTRWQNQTTKTADSTWIVDRLRDICKNGSDEYHYLGSSSINPTKPNTTQFGFSDFPTVIQTFFTNIGITPPVTANCNPYLITVPKPYDKQPSLANSVVMTKPTDCECTQLNNLFFEYSNAGYLGTFSSYLETKYQTFISQGALDTLRQLCAGTYTCVYLPTPIVLPPLLQCHGTGGTTPANTCITCQQYNVIKDSFAVIYNHAAPISNPQTQTDLDWNKAFENYANYKTGFSKHWSDYVNFGNTCNAQTLIACDSLNSVLQQFYQSLVYNQNPTGLICRQAFVDFFNNAFGVYYNYDQWMNMFLQSCGTQPSPCSFKLTCVLLKQYINEFYDTYGGQVFKNANCSLLFTTFINNKIGANFTYAQIDANYQYLCGSACPLDVCSFPNAILLTKVYDLFKISYPQPWNLPDCQQTFADYFNNYFGLPFGPSAPLLGFAGIKSVYYDPYFSLGCVPDLANLCNPPYSCKILTGLAENFINVPDSIGNPPLTCQQRFANYFNSAMGTSYTYNQIAAMYLSICGTPLNVCDVVTDCTAMITLWNNYVAGLCPVASDDMGHHPCDLDCATVNDGFVTLFNSTFGTDYATIEQIQSLYQKCNFTLVSPCGGVISASPVISPTSLNDFLTTFNSTYLDPPTQLGNQCQSVFTAMFNANFSTVFTYDEIAAYYLAQLQITLNVCNSECAKINTFVTDFSNQYSNLKLPQAAKEDLLLYLYNQTFVQSVSTTGTTTFVTDGSSSITDNKSTATVIGIADVYNAIRACGNSNYTLSASGTISIYDPQVLLSLKQVYYILHPNGMPTDCQADFQGWFNSVMQTQYDYTALLNLYNSVCGNNSGYICSVPIDGGNGKSVAINDSYTGPLAAALAQPPLLCGLNEPVFHPVTVTYNPCKDLDKIAFTAAEEKWQLYVDSIRNVFDTAYYNKCIKAKDLESFTVTYQTSEYHYTLYYYDQAGNLVKTVPPAGVDDRHSDAAFLLNVKTKRLNVKNGQSESTNQLTPNHTLVTEYRYNSLNQVVVQKTPDAGISRFWYDRLGRLVVSQNAKQYVTNRFSYTLYDALGRITQVGQKPQAIGSMNQSVSKDATALNNWLTASQNAEQITRTVYDVSYYNGEAMLSPTPLVQKNLRNRVSYTQVFDVEPVASMSTDPNKWAGVHNSAAYYSYDIHGAVDTIVQDYAQGIMATSLGGNRFKKIAYNYNLISGNVNYVSYQPGQIDAFYHRYSYDAENRITDVETSHDKLVWEKEARYQYYKNGPLARTILGQQQVQGIDYAYTLTGILKGINSTSVADGSFDIGEDGKTGSMVNPVARDVFGFSLNYYSGDYKAIGGNVPFASISAFGNTGANLYNGNISSMVVNLPKLGEAKAYGFKYDQLNRCLAMDVYEGLNNSTNAFTAIDLNGSYKERLTYDANGNIKTYLRNGFGSSLNLNNYNYTYTNGSNKVQSIANSVNNNTGTYAYDEIGNTTKDDKQNVASAVWNVYGKLQTVVKIDGSQIQYTYDAAGHRISKTVGSIVEYFVNDAQGNTIATYKKDAALNNGHLTTTEFNKYGNSLLGTQKTAIDVELPVINSGIVTFVRGETVYYLNDHRGNNLATVSDKKLQHSANSTTVDYYYAELVTASYYSAYGAISNSFNVDKIDKGHNGQKISREISPTAQTAEFWEYNGDVGRRWNVDPKPSVSISVYSVFGDNPIWFVDSRGDTITPIPPVYKTLSPVIVVSKNYRKPIPNQSIDFSGSRERFLNQYAPVFNKWVDGKISELKNDFDSYKTKEIDLSKKIREWMKKRDKDLTELEPLIKNFKVTLEEALKGNINLKAIPQFAAWPSMIPDLVDMNIIDPTDELLFKAAQTNKALYSDQFGMALNAVNRHGNNKFFVLYVSKDQVTDIVNNGFLQINNMDLRYNVNATENGGDVAATIEGGASFMVYFSQVFKDAPVVPINQLGILPLKTQWQVHKR